MNKDLVRELLICAEALSDPALPVTAESQESFRRFYDAYLNPSPPPVATKDAEAAILKILSDGPQAADQIYDCLAKRRIQLETPGLGFLLAILTNLEHAGLIVGQFDPGYSVRKYQLTDPGGQRLRNVSGQLAEFPAPVAALWALNPSE